MKRDLTALKAIIKADYQRHVKRFDGIQEEKEIIFIGDSMVAYFPLKAFGFESRCHNFGIPGDTTLGVINRLHQVIRLKPKTLIIHIGLNDEVLLSYQAEKTIEHIKTIIKEVKSSLPQTKIVVVSLTPINQTKFPHGTYVIDRDPKFAIKVNDALKGIEDIVYLDVYELLLDIHGELHVYYTTDGIHLNHEGYQVYMEALKSIL